MARAKVIEILKAYPNDPKKAVEVAKIYVSEGVTKEERERLIEIVKEKPDQSVSEIKKQMSVPRKRYELLVVLPITYYERFLKASEKRDMEPPDLAKSIIVDWIDHNVPT